MFIGRIYSSIIRLLGSSLPEEGNKGEDIDTSLRAFTVDPAKVANIEDLIKNQLVLLYMSFLGPVIVNIHIQNKLGKDGNPIVQANNTHIIELGFDPDTIT